MKILKIIFEITVIIFLIFELVILFHLIRNDNFFEDDNPILFLMFIGLSLFISGFNCFINKNFRNKIWIGLIFLLGIISIILIFTYDH